MKRSRMIAPMALAAVVLTAGSAIAEPVKIRIGRGSAAEEQLWLLKAMPSIAKHQGKDYTIEMTRFRGTDKRFQAYEAGALDVATGSANSVIFAASEGVKLTIVASLSKETKKGFNTKYMVRSDSGINSVKDLKGKVIAVNGLKSSIHLWALIVLKNAGLDPAKDVRFAPVRFPAHGAALKSGKVDVGAFPQPFAHITMQKGDAKVLFTSKDAVPFDEELILLVMKPSFIAKHPKATKAFLADLSAATKYYLANPKKARQAIIDAKMTRIPPKIYFTMKDYERAPDSRVDVDALKKMQDVQLKVGFQRKKIDIGLFVNNRLLP